jgi:hypothetical protein
VVQNDAAAADHARKLCEAVSDRDDRHHLAWVDS